MVAGSGRFHMCKSIRAGGGGLIRARGSEHARAAGCQLPSPS
jgi:hypothetical protein